MKTQMNLSKTLLSTIGMLAISSSAALFASSAQANTIDENNSSKAPMVLAYYYGPGYYNHGPYWGGRYHYVCPRTCWRNAWGYVHCARRC